MLEFTEVFYVLFLDPQKNLSDVESIFEKQQKSPVITNAQSLYDALERSESTTRNLARETATEVTAIRQRTWIHQYKLGELGLANGRRTHEISGGLEMA